MSSSTTSIVITVCILSNSLHCFSVPRDGRVHDRILSREHHFESDGTHNQVYDHEAFLGEQESRAFDQLSPAESKKRLGEIVDKIDADHDKYVTFEELQSWILKQQKSYIHDDINRQWKSYNPDTNAPLKWEDYRKATYGFMEDLDDGKASSGLTDEDSKTYQDMMRRDRRRWQLADQNHDGSLNREEFTDFLHPEEAPHMQSAVVDETLEDMDKNKDGKISLEEYINDMYLPDAKEESVPEWVIREREQFRDYRDKNKDGFMDKEEIKLWILPPDYDHSEAEARHLMSESDANKDGQLSKQEILDNYDIFVGSQATDFGEALVTHDEF